MDELGKFKRVHLNPNPSPAAMSALARGDLDNFVVASTPGGIEAQEKAGQQMLVASSDLPKDMSPNREAFEAVGFKFGEDVDELFVKCTLPAGWKREASDHSMWSYIVDEEGRKRVGVFYKAAFYDRRADCRLEPKYAVQSEYPTYPRDANSKVTVLITAGGLERRIIGDVDYTDHDGETRLRDEARAWLDQNYPLWKDPTAYWRQ